MLTSRSAVYLSGDFRLTYPWGHRDDPRVQKLVPIFRLGWSALVSFAGVAKTTWGLDVGDWISEQLQDIEMDAKFEELPKRLLSADAWLSRVSGDRSLVFSIVGFIGRRPVSMVVSNFMNINGHIFDPIKPGLKKSDSRPKEPEVKVAGDRGAVRDEDIKQLKKMLVANCPPLEVQAAIATVNGEAANRSRTISKACITGHLLPTGAAEVMPHTVDVWGEYLPGFVKRDLAAQGIRGFNRKVDQNGNQLSPKWRGMTATRARGPRRRQEAAVTIHAIGNVEGPPLTGGTSGYKTGNSQAFWKVAGKDESDRYTFQINWSKD
jgi:hypothetical protein